MSDDLVTKAAVLVTTKVCSKCRVEKPLTEFFRQTMGKGGYRAACKACQKVANRTWYERNRERHAATVKAYAQANRDHLRRSRAAWAKANPDRIKVNKRRHRLKKEYGLTMSDYDRLLAKQDGRCAICGRGPNGRGDFHVDHDHDTGRVRGLLCAACNPALGAFGDDPELLRRALRYLGQPTCEHVQRADEGTAFCSLSVRDIERVQREHRDELARLREIDAMGRELVRRIRGAQAGRVQIPVRIAEATERFAALLDQKEQSTDE